MSKFPSSAKLTSEARSMAAMFKRALAAEIHQKTRYHKTGRLNMSRVMNYKFTENIFLQREQRPEGLSHGMSILVDASWSMNTSYKLGYASSELIKLVEFCIAAKVPYQVFTFEGINFHNMNYVPIISSYISRQKQKEILDKLKKQYDETGKCFKPNGGTPLEKALLQSIPLIELLRDTFQIDIHNFFLLTDGLSNFSSEVVYNGKYFPVNERKTSNVAFHGIMSFFKIYSEVVASNNFWLHIEDEITPQMRDAIDHASQTAMFGYKMNSKGIKYLSGAKYTGVDGIVLKDDFRDANTQVMRILAEQMNNRKVKI